jgi:hypothetical protein
MMRATGFFLGTLLMLAVFLFALSDGNPPTLVKEVVNSAADTSTGPAEPAASMAPATTATDPVPAGDVSVDNTDDSAATAVTEPASPDAESLGSVNASGLELDPASWNQSMAVHETATRHDAGEVSRYQVWSPFRSEWAAAGFARRLALATDVPVEVVNEGPGNYQVVFSYRDDGERQAMIEHIETVTGLDLE